MSGGDACIVLQEMEAYGACNACPTGHSTLVGSNGFPECQCSPGYAAENGGMSPVGSTSGTQCTMMPGYQTTATGLDVEPCPPNSTNDGSRLLCACNAGFGRSSAAHDIPCSECAAGKYKSSVGDVLCTVCAVGFLSIGSGQTSPCVPCPLGTMTFADQTRCAPFQTNFIVNVTDDYRAIFRSGDTAATALLTAATARQSVDATLVYDAATREENLWQHITNQTTRSCQDLIAEIAAIPDIEDQYMRAVRLLKRDGPCAPGFTGYDLLQDPGNAEFADSECVLLATTAEKTRRDALLVVQRRYMGRDATDQYEIYNYSAQYLTPALVRRVFGSEVRDGAQASFCNVRNRELSPAALETALSRVGLWTLPQDVVGVDVEGLVETAQIRQSVACP